VARPRRRGPGATRTIHVAVVRACGPCVIGCSL
jgi:hypothetical protein